MYPYPQNRRLPYGIYRNTLLNRREPYNVDGGRPRHFVSLLGKRKASRFKGKPASTVLTASEEDTLVEWIYECCRRGMPVTKLHLCNSVALLVKKLNIKSPFTHGRPGQGWYRGFKKRHSTAFQKLKENNYISRIQTREDGVRKWFLNLKSYLEEQQLLNIDPSRVFSTETCFLRGTENPSDKKSLMVQFVGNAAGQLLPPMLTYVYRNLPFRARQSLPNDCRIFSLSGHTTAENIYEYISKCLFVWLNEKKVKFPIVLFINSQVPFFTLALTEFCSKNKIVMIALPPNTSHMLEPLSVALFPRLREAWKIALDDYCLRNNTRLSQENVAPFLELVLNSLNIVNILKNGFRMCNLYPMSNNIFTDAAEKTRAEQHIEIVPFSANGGESTGTYAKVMQVLENLMDNKTLQTFRRVNESDKWTGNIEDTNLFCMWRLISYLCKTGASSNDSEENSDTKYKIEEIDLESDDFASSTKDLEIIYEGPRPKYRKIK